MKMIFKFILMAMFLATAKNSAAVVYKIDQAHSTIGFTVKHLVVSTVRGQLTDYVGTIDFDKDNLTTSHTDVTIQAASINTGNNDRDNHLRTGDFFDVENNPTITFKSKSIAQAGSDYAVTGDLTIRGVTKEITIPVSIAGPVQGPSGDQVIGLTGQTTINRQDFGVSWNKALDTGGLVVSDDVTLVIEIEAHAK